MMLASLFSSLYILTAPAQIAIDPEIEQAKAAIQSHHLTTDEGRSLFVTVCLDPFVNEADQLNHEIQDLALKISSIEIPETDHSKEEKEQMVCLSEVLNQKMETMLEMLPVLQTALLIESDFEHLDSVLAKEDPLDKTDKDLLMRLSSLCTYLDSR